MQEGELADPITDGVTAIIIAYNPIPVMAHIAFNSRRRKFPMTCYRAAREKYKPDKIKLLFIAEAPPKADTGRFFYYEDVQRGDSLFLELMKVLYPDEYTIAREVRNRKRYFLEKFRNEGFYLLDSVENPMENGDKVRQIKAGLPVLIGKLKNFADTETPIILIAATVYKACAEVLKAEGYNVLNERAVPFPGSGQQTRFRQEIGHLIKKYREQEPQA